LLPCSTATLRKRLSRAYTAKLHSPTPTYALYYDRYRGAMQWHMGADLKRDYNKAATAAGLPGIK
jgi:hypothetical protein